MVVWRWEGLLRSKEKCIIENLQVAVAGLGMGSVVVEALARFGIEKFRVCDFDKVEESNIGHQIFDTTYLGMNKAVATKEILLRINPKLSVETWEEPITKNNAERFVEGMHIIIDCIDPTPSLEPSLALSEVAFQRNIPFLYPTDLGWGAGILVLVKSKLEKYISDVQDLARVFTIPPYLNVVISKFLDGTIHHYPQPITSTLLASVLVVTALIRLIRGERKDFLLQIDPYELNVVMRYLLF